MENEALIEKSSCIGGIIGMISKLTNDKQNCSLA